MDIIGVYIADIITTATLTLIATTATITIIVACIITITAIGETNRVSSRQQTSPPQGKGRSLDEQGPKATLSQARAPGLHPLEV
jgi:hypothetical protein